MLNNCQNLYFLSALACQLSECLSEEEIEILAADLIVLGDMLESLQAHQSTCKNNRRLL